MVVYPSTVTRKPILPALALLLTALALWLAWRWQPARAVEHRFERLLTAAADRKFDRLERLFDPAYADRWGMDRTTVLREGREVLRQFFALALVPDPDPPFVQQGPGPDQWTVRARIRVEGTGTPIAEFAKAEANRITADWSFTFRKADWKPWNWTLVRLDNPSLDLSRRPDGW